MKRLVIEKNGKFGAMVEATTITTKATTEANDISIATGVVNLLNKNEFSDGDYLPFFPSTNEIKYFNDSGDKYWVYNDGEKRYYTTDLNKVFKVVGGVVGVDANKVVTTSVVKEFKAFAFED